MLIKLDDSIMNMEELNNNIKDSLDNIALSMREGNHIVIASKKVLHYIIKIKGLEKKTISTFNYILKNRTTISTVMKRVEAFILVVNNTGDITRCTDRENKVVFKVPIEKFKVYDRLSPSMIVSEDESDCDFYKGICQKYIKEKNIGLQINLKEVNGGGGKTGVNYEKHLTKYGEKLLVIVDSDKKHKNDDIGDTAREVKKKYDLNKDKYITDMYILSVREKENLITPKMYKLCSNSLNSLKSLELLQYIEGNSMLKNLYYYCDIKDGITYNELFNDIENSNSFFSYIEDRKNAKCFNTIINRLNKIDRSDLSNLVKNLDGSLNLETMQEICCSKINEDGNPNIEDRITDKIGYLVDDFMNDIFYDQITKKIENKKNVSLVMRD